MATHPIERIVTDPRVERDRAISAAHTLLNHLRDTLPRWSHEMPCEEGYYWCRTRKGDRAEVVQIRLDYGEKDVPLVVQSGSPANVGVQYLRDYRGCHWCGPLEMPHES